MVKFILKIVILAIFLFSFSPTVMAHFFGGYKVENVSGDYIYGVNFNTPKPYSGTPLNINIHLYKDNINNTVSFSNVQIKIKQFNHEHLDRVVPFAEGDNTNTEFTFPGPGRYKIYLTYFQGDKQLASPDFELAVSDPPSSGSVFASNLVLWSPAFILLLLLGFWARSIQKKV